MKHTTTKLLSIILVIAVMAVLVFTMNATAASTGFDTMVERLATLEKLANEYKSSNKLSASIDQLMFSYIRSTRYSSTSWNTLAGTPDSDFIAYVQEQSPDTANLRTMGDITLPNGDVTDAVHMFAVMNMIHKGFGDLGGWLGDACQMIQDIQNESGDAEQLTAKARQHFRIDGHFGLQDWVADMDGYNLTQEKQDKETWAACLSRYFATNLTEKQRVGKFIQKNWGTSYTSETSTKANYRSLVKSRYSSDLKISALEISTFGLFSVPADKYRSAVCYAVADYMYETMCATVPGEDDIQINYSDETIQISDGIEVNSNRSFNGNKVVSGSKITPGSTVYARGVRDVENGSFFVSEVAEITIPSRPDAPAAPQLSATTAGSLTFVDGEGLEFSADGGETWQDTGVFSELVPNTKYQVICRYKAGDAAFASNDSQATSAETELPEGLFVNNKGAFYTAGANVKTMLMATFDKNGKMTDLISGSLENGMWMCTPPAGVSEGRVKVFVLSTNNSPLVQARTVVEAA